MDREGSIANPSAIFDSRRLVAPGHLAINHSLSS